MRALHSQNGRVGSSAGASWSGRLQQEHCSSLWRLHHRSRHTASRGAAAAAARGQGAAGPHNSSSSSSNSSRSRGPTQLQLQPQQQQQQQQRVVCSQAVSSSVSPAPSDQRQDQGARSELPAGPAAPPLQGKNGVLLLNLGGPESLEDVRPFLYNLFADPDIIRLPETLKFLQPLLANIIATLRSPKSSEGYAAIGGGSPLRRITDEQADALGKALRSRGLDAEVYVAMRYWHPYTEEALQHVVRDGITHLVILPLYPQFSISTSGSSLRLLEQLFKSDPVLRNLKHTVIPSWYQRPGYVGAMVDLIEQELNKFDTPEQVNVFFSAHGVPKSYVEEAGDPYKEEMEECVALIMAELRRRGRLNDHTLAYQSRVGPVEWLQPYTDDSIRSLGAAGVKSLLAVPISFVSEHIETLEEIDMEYRELALESGVQKWGRVPALNTNARFIEDLADAVVEALPYVGVIAGAPTTGNALVPMGDLDTLLDAYDRDRRTLPAPVEPWSWGWTKSAETWNGRIAMVAIIVILLLEATTGQSFLSNVMVLD